MKKGFTLIELVIAVAISAIISTALYMLLYQTQRTVSTVLNITSDDATRLVMYQQLFRDITGAFAPPESWPRSVAQQPLKQQEPNSADTKKQESPDQNKSQEKKDLQQSEQKQKITEQPPDINNVFVYTAKSSMLSNLTFISHNPLSVYNDPEQATSVVRAVRIMYSLKPDINDPDSLILMRQESSNLDAKKFQDTKKIRAYELARGIRNISAQFIYEPSTQEEKEENESKESAETEEEPDNKKKQVKRYRTATSWSSDELVQKPGSMLVPSYIRIKAEFTNSHNPLEMLIPIYAPGAPNRTATAQPVPMPPAQKKPEPASNGAAQQNKKPAQPVPAQRGARI